MCCRTRRQRVSAIQDFTVSSRPFTRKQYNKAANIRNQPPPKATDMKANLNDIDPVDDGFLRLDKNNIEQQICSVSAYFRNIKAELIANINKADAVFGCVAWLSNPDIINALASREILSVVISEKQDVKSISDLKLHKNWITPTHLANNFNHFYTLTNSITLGVEDISLNLPLCSIRQLRERDIWVEENVRDKHDGDSPYLHNKFVVFASLEYSKENLQDASIEYWGNKTEGDPQGYIRRNAKPIINPYAVWTGSFNFSSAAERHLENAVLIHGNSIAEKYFREFAQIYLLSTRLQDE